MHGQNVPKRDLYNALDVGNDAPLEEIKASYRRLALENHPDKAGDTPENNATFAIIREAYEVLSDLVKRRVYDGHRYEEKTGEDPRRKVHASQRSHRSANERSRPVPQSYPHQEQSNRREERRDYSSNPYPGHNNQSHRTPQQPPWAINHHKRIDGEVKVLICKLCAVRARTVRLLKRYAHLPRSIHRSEVHELFEDVIDATGCYGTVLNRLNNDLKEPFAKSPRERGRFLDRYLSLNTSLIRMEMIQSSLEDVVTGLDQTPDDRVLLELLEASKSSEKRTAPEAPNNELSLRYPCRRE
ncbi:hypothetical protein DL766_000145 [Monosporascus sp. MC13-8B]|uniref:J domain-containing protein n=1 Tax=Monosporascus cannonballus TaxID=155416 RepID=A0ABY0H7C6_9PEZI|nr:hypothetical protein DL762_004588 [Monosporascus cannonballus]RYO92217.1 hypothetical protein DL763_004747 [Monosporascus cannonballus]RYP39936.1 hypothetical protein DL766_000145 [Monosporascus sp. MC13-8B]